MQPAAIGARSGSAGLQLTDELDDVFGVRDDYGSEGINSSSVSALHLVM